MKTSTHVSVLKTYLNHISKDDLTKLLAAMDEHSHAAMNGGLSAQNAAIDKVNEAASTAIDNLDRLDREHLDKWIPEFLK